ncbi:Thiamine-monophosphate kinase [hydrothermal vent metagenome]|uniref:Thiamine-monophosphate kinase n=1 Tax=hydrothermal vent metagenome TaxID=652676 RepID=A0A3B1BG13_9ZZZZ
MSVSEFEIINRYFACHSFASENIILGIGDDAAVVSVAADKQLVVSIDTLISGVHFPVQTSAADIAWKALAVNLSDLAAMGASPAWFTLALSLPQVDHNWLAAFSESLADISSAYHIPLIGGDTTRGPLSITIQVAGHVKAGQALLRSGAKVGDQIFVSGSIGDAALGLYLLQQQAENLGEKDYLRRDLIRRLNRPQPRIELGQALSGIASACIDISDGLFADLAHILKTSKVGARLQQAQIPLSEAAQQFLTANPQLRSTIYNRGDDYELCFCVPAEKCGQLEMIEKAQYCRLSHIGEIVSGDDLQLFDVQNNRLDYRHDSYDHFAKKT